MKRTLFIVLAVVGFASAASAASLTLAADKTTYNPGETITLTITGDDAGATSYGIQGVLLYDGALVNNGTRTQTSLTGPYGKWTSGVLFEKDTGALAGTYSFAFSQGTGYAQGANQLPGALSTVTLIAKSAGVVSIDWQHGGPNNSAFFGLPDGSFPTTSLTIIPEPTAAALLSLGLIGLAWGGGRRRS
jgi:hypothetical protein